MSEQRREDRMSDDRQRNDDYRQALHVIARGQRREITDWCIAHHVERGIGSWSTGMILGHIALSILLAHEDFPADLIGWDPHWQPTQGETTP